MTLVLLLEALSLEYYDIGATCLKPEAKNCMTPMLPAFKPRTL